MAAIILSVCTLTFASPRHEWTQSDLIGLSIERVDPVDIEQMTFAIDGIVAVTIGAKGGSLTAPVFTWRLHNGRLQIFDDEHKLYDELTLESRDASTIVARSRSGQTFTYRILKKRSA